MVIEWLFQGSVRERACPQGSYQPNEGQSSCEPCPAGLSCQEQGTVCAVLLSMGRWIDRWMTNARTLGMMCVSFWALLVF